MPMNAFLRRRPLIGLALTIAVAFGCRALAGAAADDTKTQAAPKPAKPAEPAEPAEPAKRAGDGAEGQSGPGRRGKSDHADGAAELAKFMRAKLDASSKVLDGLCTEDFEKIVAGATSLKEVSSAEQWRVSTDVMYRQHSAEFRGTVDDLLQAAEKKNLDGAALAWTRSTLSCIECHRWVRATLITGP
jgi:hypothetical protein